MSNPSLANCNLGRSTGGLTLNEMSKLPKFGEAIRENTPWGQLPDDLVMPTDANVGQTLDRIDRMDPERDNGTSRKAARNAILDLHKLDSCVWPLSDLETLADDFLASELPNASMTNIDEYLIHLVSLAPDDHFNPDTFDAEGSDVGLCQLIKTVEGRIGHIQRWQAACSKPYCPDPCFRIGQSPTLDDQRRWTHPGLTATNVPPYPLLKIEPNTIECTRCTVPFRTWDSISPTLFFEKPVHIYAQDGRIRMCPSATKTGSPVSRIEGRVEPSGMASRISVDAY